MLAGRPGVQPERHPVQAAEVRRDQPDVVRQSRGEHQNQASLRQGLPVQPGKCASDASGVVLPEAWKDDLPLLLPEPAVSDAQRWGDYAAERQEQPSVPCRSDEDPSAA